MTWFKLDDQFHSQPKVIAAGNAAIGLYCRLGTYCADKLTDGFIPAAVAKSMGTARELRALLDTPIPGTRSLLTVVEAGYLMRDYLEYNPTREKVLADREAAKERMAAGRSKKRSGEHRANSEANVGRSSDPPDPDPPTTRITTSSHHLHGSVDGLTIEEAVTAVADGIVRYRAQDIQVRNWGPYLDAGRPGVIEEHGDRIVDLIQRFPTAPIATLVSAVEAGESRALAAFQAPAEPDPDIEHLPRARRLELLKGAGASPRYTDPAVGVIDVPLPATTEAG